MKAIQRSIALIKASRQIVSINPNLVAYPLVSTFFSLILISVFMVPLVYFQTPSHTLPSWVTPAMAHYGPAAISLVSLVLFQWLSAFVGSAFYVAADAALQGERMPFKVAFGQAWQNRLLITKWAVFAGLIGFVINQLEQRLNFVGSLVARVFGVAWSLATVFAVPVLVRRKLSPVQALKYSGSLFKKTWGEQLVAESALGAVMVIPVLLVSAIGFSLLLQVSAEVITVAFAVKIACALLVLLVALGSYVMAVEAIFNAALYRYADTGDYVGPFSHELINGAYRSKKRAA